MSTWLAVTTAQAVIVINWMALIVVVFGTVDAFIRCARVVARPDAERRRTVWLRYLRLLVAGMTFQLAADIVESSITTSWDTIGRLAVVAVIRTLLNFFLERDLLESERRETERAVVPRQGA